MTRRRPRRPCQGTVTRSPANPPPARTTSRRPAPERTPGDALGDAALAGVGGRYPRLLAFLLLQRLGDAVVLLVERCDAHPAVAQCARVDVTVGGAVRLALESLSQTVRLIEGAGQNVVVAGS